MTRALAELPELRFSSSCSRTSTFDPVDLLLCPTLHPISPDRTHCRKACTAPAIQSLSRPLLLTRPPCFSAFRSS
ncbi:hypothetical protein KFK09_003937 [Dendrobium nobile]|uniref:Uncharacterized protein n=1 Tax=Dendrobium nobile TaxID=94219 RepID=A0A8T3C2L7_DENNO|nr:hypothetical protein KFK09_003937 [Dendrobium nobile]